MVLFQCRLLLVQVRLLPPPLLLLGSCPDVLLSLLCSGLYDLLKEVVKMQIRFSPICCVGIGLTYGGEFPGEQAECQYPT